MQHPFRRGCSPPATSPPPTLSRLRYPPPLARETLRSCTLKRCVRYASDSKNTPAQTRPRFREPPDDDGLAATRASAARRPAAQIPPAPRSTPLTQGSHSRSPRPSRQDRRPVVPPPRRRQPPLVCLFVGSFAVFGYGFSPIRQRLPRNENSRRRRAGAGFQRMTVHPPYRSPQQGKPAWGIKLGGHGAMLLFYFSFPEPTPPQNGGDAVRASQPRSACPLSLTVGVKGSRSPEAEPTLADPGGLPL